MFIIEITSQGQREERISDFLRRKMADPYDHEAATAKQKCTCPNCSNNEPIRAKGFADYIKQTVGRNEMCPEYIKWRGAMTTILRHCGLGKIAEKELEEAAKQQRPKPSMPTDTKDEAPDEYDWAKAARSEASTNKAWMDFGDALHALKAGKKVAREGWNGKGMYLYHVPANSYPSATAIATKEFGGYTPYGAYIAMKTAQGNVVPWTASQTDILADDWRIV